MAFQPEFEKQFLNIKINLGFLINKLHIANIDCENAENNYPCFLPDEIREPLARSNAVSESKPWMLSKHYVLENYELNSDIGIYCKNFNIQREFMIIKRRISYWLYVIKHTKELYYSHGKSVNDIINSFPAFSSKTLYLPMQDLIRDLNYNFTPKLFEKESEKELFLYIIHSIIEEPIDWKLYNIDNPDCFVEIDAFN